MSKPIVQSYLFFGGRCDEALDFYKSAIDAQVQMIMRYSDSPEPLPPDRVPAGWENKVMHASFHVGDTLVMASDGCGENHPFASFSLSLGVTTEAEADRYFKELSEGGTVDMPLSQTFWSPRFGMLTDKFGMSWMVSVIAADQRAA